MVITLQIDGMSCGHCLNAINRALAGVTGATVRQLRMGRAEVEVADSALAGALMAAVAKAGYHATVTATG